jgi:hypothetical protein
MVGRDRGELDVDTSDAPPGVGMQRGRESGADDAHSEAFHGR